MGPDGVLLISKGVTVLVPISELWRLAEELVQPELPRAIR